MISDRRLLIALLIISGQSVRCDTTVSRYEIAPNDIVILSSFTEDDSTKYKLLEQRGDDEIVLWKHGSFIRRPGEARTFPAQFISISKGALFGNHICLL